MTIRIYQGAPSGTLVYEESHQTTTNTNGLLSLEIGGGNPTLGTFSSINWAIGPYYLATEALLPNGPINSTTQLLSVPYALYAEQSGTPGPAGPQGIPGPIGPQGIPGDTGLTGPQGPAGPTGATGLQGPIGLQGIPGDTGLTGPQGPMGPQGIPGTPGSLDAWARLGNAGTTPAVNFIGTTDNADLVMRTNNMERARIAANGFVGIGTTTPGALLHVNGGNVRFIENSQYSSLYCQNANTTFFERSATLTLSVSANTTQRNEWTIYAGGPNGYSGVAANSLSIYEYPYNSAPHCCPERFEILHTQNGWIAVTIDGVGHIAGNGFSIPSDSTLKTDLVRLKDASSKIRALGGYQYRYLHDSQLDDGEEHIGILAQEVRRVLPQAVRKHPSEEFLIVNYDALIPLLIEGFKEQQTLIETQQQFLQAQQTRILILEAAMEATQSRLQSIETRFPSDAQLGSKR